MIVTDEQKEKDRKSDYIHYLRRARLRTINENIERKLPNELRGALVDYNTYNTDYEMQLETNYAID